MTSFATHSKKNYVESSHQSIMTVVSDARMLFRMLPCIIAGHPMAILCSIVSAFVAPLNSRDEFHSSQPASVTLDRSRLPFHCNSHAGAAPAQIGMKTGAAEFSVFMWYNVLKRGKLQSTAGGVACNSSAAKAVF